MKKARFLTQAAVIGAMYAALTVLFTFSSYGLIQFRISEALTILPAFTPAAIPGLFIGCVVSNFYGYIAGQTFLFDIFIGSGATLLSAWLTRLIPYKLLKPLPPVIINALVVGVELSVVLKYPLLIAIGQVGLGELVICYGLGMPLLMLLEKHKHRIFKL
jgi:uncharacterized membrane protein